MKSFEPLNLKRLQNHFRFDYHIYFHGISDCFLFGNDFMTKITHFGALGCLLSMKFSTNSGPNSIVNLKVILAVNHKIMKVK